ncbi:hypothetical protein M133_3100 [Bacteroides fragilis str. S24L26]|nr:hypothetical protein M133_3100 [Bacteroides fragilis str. S24L26]EYA79494.1 hypothetical protein M134_3235 [Bacteroides fragilis str. S24L34]
MERADSCKVLQGIPYIDGHAGRYLGSRVFVHSMVTGGIFK